MVLAQGSSSADRDVCKLEKRLGSGARRTGWGGQIKDEIENAPVGVRVREAFRRQRAE